MMSKNEDSAGEEPPLGIKCRLTLNMTADDLGRAIRDEWCGWASEQVDPPPHHLIPWDELDEHNREADRRIGLAVARIVMTNLSDDSEPPRELAVLQAIVDAQTRFKAATTSKAIQDAKDEQWAAVEAARALLEGK